MVSFILCTWKLIVMKIRTPTVICLTDMLTIFYSVFHRVVTYQYPLCSHKQLSAIKEDKQNINKQWNSNEDKISAQLNIFLWVLHWVIESLNHYSHTSHTRLVTFVPKSALESTLQKVHTFVSKWLVSWRMNIVYSVETDLDDVFNLFEVNRVAAETSSD